MADNSQDNISGVSPEDKIRNQELIGFLKERLRIATEYKDILRESINEARKMAREIERQNSRIETINRETINTKELNNEIVRVQQAQYVNAQKLLDIQTQHGITEENIARTMERYNKGVNEKVEAEAAYNKLIHEQNLTLDKINEDQNSSLERAKQVLDAKNLEQKLTVQLEDYKKTSLEQITSLEDSYNSAVQQHKLAIMDLEQKIIAIQLEGNRAAAAGDDAAFESAVKRLEDLQKEQLLAQQTHKEIQDNLYKELEIRKMTSDQTVADLNKQLAQTQQIAQTALTAEEEKYVLNSQALDQAEATLNVKKQELDATLAQMTEGQLAYIQGKEQEKTLEQQLNLTKQKADLEKEVSNNLGLSGGFAKMLADKLGVGNQVYGAMTLKAREIAETEQRRKDLTKQLAQAQADNNTEQVTAINQQLNGLGKQQGMLSTRFSVMKAGATGAFKAMGNAMKDPVAMAGLIGAGVAAVSTGLNAVGNAAKGAGNFMAGLSSHSSNFVRNLTSGITGLIEKIPIVGGLIAGLIDGMAAFADLVLGQDDYIVKMGRSIGISADQANKLYDRFVAINMQARGTKEENLLNTEQNFESYIQLSKNLGVVSGITDEMVKQNAIFQKRLGLGEQETSQLLKTQQISGVNAKNIVASTLGQIESTRQLTGVAFSYKEILKTTTSLSGVLGLQFAKYPEKITKAVISTKALGMELSKLDSTADSFLDFESSISKEFEAQLLTGKDINLNRARELALNNDLAGLAEEISNQLGDSESFANMNRIQQEAIASALGMSRNELGDILKQQSYYSKLGVQDEKSYKEKIKYLREIGDTQERQNYEAKIGAEQLQALMDQSALEDFESIINKIKVAFVDFAKSTGFVDKIKEFLDDLAEPGKMQEFLRDMRDTFAKVAGAVAEIVYQIVNAIDYIPFVDIPPKLLKDLKYAADTVGERISNTGKLNQEEFEQAKAAGTIKQKEAGGAYFDYNKETKKFGAEVEYKKGIATQAQYEQIQVQKQQVAGNNALLMTGGFGMAPSVMTKAMEDNKKLNESIKTEEEKIKNSAVKHADGGIFSKATTLIEPKTSTPHTFGEAGPEILTPLEKLEDYIMKPIDKMMQIVESKFDSVVLNAADFIKSNTTSNELDKIIDLTTSILTGKSKEDNYAKAQPQLQVAQSERPAEYVFNIKTEVKGIDEKVVGEANQRYAFQLASSKIERRTGPF